MPSTAVPAVPLTWHMHAHTPFQPAVCTVAVHDAGCNSLTMSAIHTTGRACSCAASSPTPPRPRPSGEWGRGPWLAPRPFQSQRPTCAETVTMPAVDEPVLGGQRWSRQSNVSATLFWGPKALHCQPVHTYHTPSMESPSWSLDFPREVVALHERTTTGLQTAVVPGVPRARENPGDLTLTTTRTTTIADPARIRVHSWFQLQADRASPPPCHTLPTVRAETFDPDASANANKSLRAIAQAGAHAPEKKAAAAAVGAHGVRVQALATAKKKVCRSRRKLRVCSICNYTSNRKSNYDRHMGVHNRQAQMMLQVYGAGGPGITDSGKKVPVKKQGAAELHSCAWPGCSWSTNEKTKLHQHYSIHTEPLYLRTQASFLGVVARDAANQNQNRDARVLRMESLHGNISTCSKGVVDL